MLMMFVTSCGTERVKNILPVASMLLASSKEWIHLTQKRICFSSDQDRDPYGLDIHKKPSVFPGWGILIFYNSSLVILSLVFHSSFMQCYPLGSSYLVGRVFRGRVRILEIVFVGQCEVFVCLDFVHPPPPWP